MFFKPYDPVEVVPFVLEAPDAARGPEFLEKVDIKVRDEGHPGVWR